jgi:hypothetical protein
MQKSLRIKERQSSSRLLGWIEAHDSFLRYKEELMAYDFQVDKISLKNWIVKFNKVKRAD